MSAAYLQFRIGSWPPTPPLHSKTKPPRPRAEQETHVMQISNPVSGRYIKDLADLDLYGCWPMSVRELMEEFEQFPVFHAEPDGLIEI